MGMNMKEQDRHVHFVGNPCCVRVYSSALRVRWLLQSSRSIAALFFLEHTVLLTFRDSLGIPPRIIIFGN